VLGVTGGIAAYKAADLTSKLVQQGATVDVVLTEAGSSFISATTFEAITSRKVHSTAFEPWHGSWHGHISLGEEADAFIVAPATANVIAKLAHGIADDMLTTAALAATCPLLIAPAMEHSMYHHAATQENIGTLLGRGATMVGPNQGRLASGDVGDGRMAEPVEILGAARQLVGRNGSLAGMNVVVTAGGTVEPLDPVRYIGNRSSGRMGYELAQAAIDEGADAVLISG